MHAVFRLTFGMVFILTLSTGEAFAQYYGGYGGWGGETPEGNFAQGAGLLRTRGGRLQSGHGDRQFSRARFNHTLE